MEKNKDMVRAALAADTLALGVHWIYDAKRVAELFEPDRKPLAPQQDSYHKNAKLGDFTHYGDQTMVLLESVSRLKAFRLEDWAEHWKRLFQNDYKGYLDHATKETLDHFAAGRDLATVGSMSTDMSPAARMAPIFLLAGQGDEKTLISWVREQASLTTRQSQVLELVDFLSSVAYQALKGQGLSQALGEAGERLQDQTNQFLFKSGLDSARENEDSVKIIHRFGANCEAFKMFPGLVHLLAKYEKNPYDGLVQSILAGGDNAARSSIVAAIFAAAQGMKFMPSEWYGAVRQKERIEACLAAF